MKKKLLLVLSAFSVVLSLTNASAQIFKIKSRNLSSISALNGAWQTTWRDSGSNVSRNIYAVMYNGFYSEVGQDSTGVWQETHAGTYEISGNIYKEKILYSSHADRMGITHWQDFKISGDTLYLNFFKKLIDTKGEEIATPPRFVQKYVKVEKRR